MSAPRPRCSPRAVALVQTDIKRVIAYSTCSQLGYMFFAAGSGAYGAAMFHLFTHAFFKALLFLGAGSVIHAMHHEQDMRFYGGLRKHIPITFALMTVGTLALTGFFFTAGYYSKDAILEAAFASGTTHGKFAVLRRRAGRAVDQLLFVAAGVPDLLRRPALGGVGAYPARDARCARAWRSRARP